MTIENQYYVQTLPFTHEQRMKLYRHTIQQELVGKYAPNIWNLDELLHLNKEEVTQINFALFLNDYIRDEIKYYYKTMISAHSKDCVITLYNYKSSFRFFSELIEEFYPRITSITEIPQEILIEHCRFRYSIKESIKGQARKNLAFHSKLQSFYMNFYDKRPEYKKDLWEASRLGVDYNKTKGKIYFDFTTITAPFRELVKNYLYARLVVQKSVSCSHAQSYLPSLSLFFAYLFTSHPDWSSLDLLSRSDIVNYIKYIREAPMRGMRSNWNKQKASDRRLVRYINSLEVFIDYIQRNEFELAPKTYVKNLIFPSDKPKMQRNTAVNIKFISDQIWNQVLSNIHHLPKDIANIILLMEATGFRISDVLTLHLDCLLHTEDGYWVVGNQRKVSEPNHKVPINSDIAYIIQAQKKYIQEKLPDNPNALLFPLLTGLKKGQPYLGSTISHHLKKLAKQCNIKDEAGQIYTFKNHAFRHRFGVTLVNHGMSILHVQKLMAHTSPEMTTVYAEIHDKTKRSEWERANQKGAVRLHSTGEIIVADLEEHALEQGLELEWIRHNLDSIRLDHGFCVKSPKVHCSFLDQSMEPPCIKNNCPSFHVDRSFLSYYEQQIVKMESDISIYQHKDRLRSIEILQPKLRKYKEIIQTLQTGTGIMGMSKDLREYTMSERT
ncbi:tyrosine-type recombinase/integrase [Paenibacillus peoriae]|uniref:tyrosine-type recombinase/integrase n=1 Tax=Paenibacillus peoriae TaxID=59893 RepID=UPI0015E428BC|nr:tyrosine-type recombinase/integrase [Paenibacillus peoriae]